MFLSNNVHKGAFILASVCIGRGRRWHCFNSRNLVRRRRPSPTTLVWTHLNALNWLTTAGEIIGHPVIRDDKNSCGWPVSIKPFFLLQYFLLLVKLKFKLLTIQAHDQNVKLGLPAQYFICFLISNAVCWRTCTAYQALKRLQHYWQVDM